jgi:hypothetical protein
VVLGTGPNDFGCTPGTDANCEASATRIINVSGGANGLDAFTSGAGASLVGQNSDSFGTGVVGNGGAQGVEGSSSGGPGVFGESLGGDAVVGELPNVSTGTNAVSGQAENDGNGVDAESNSPYTIGQSGHFNAGLFAQNTSTGTALWARNLNNGGQGAYIEAHGSNSTALQVCGCDGATALNVSGPVQLSRSGITGVVGTVSAPKNSVKVSVSPVTSQSIMTATLQKYVPGVFVVAAVPNASGYFTIYLNKPVTTKVGPIAWVVVEHPFIS